MAWSESRLLNLSVVVFWVSVESHDTNLLQWVVFVWPDLGDVKNVESVGFSILLWHQLHKPGPGWEFFSMDCVEKVGS